MAVNSVVHRTEKQKEEIAEEKEFLQISKKSHFLKIDYRFENCKRLHSS